MSYLVLIGDIIASRNAPSRTALQQRLQEELGALNKTAHGLISPYTLTLGDEFQAVFTRADSVFSGLIRLLGALHPIRTRFSLGVGNITTDINPTQALGMDGPAFYQARDGIDHLKESGDLFRIEGLPPMEASLVNGTLTLLSQRMQKWQPNRLAILHDLMQGKKVQQIADSLDISEPAVYKNIHSGGLETVIQVLSAVTDLLNRHLPEKP